MFIERLGEFAKLYDVTVFCYCCMPNHFHLYLRTQEANLSRFMQGFLTSFTVSVNRRRRSSGHIFQGRFKAQLVEDELYRSKLSRYIHLNPVRMKAVKECSLEEKRAYLKNFRWSSFAQYIGVEKKADWLDREPVLSTWGTSRRERMKNYRRYVEEGLLRDVKSPFAEVKEQSLLGSDSFVDWAKREYLLKRDVDKREERALNHLQHSFSWADVSRAAARQFDVSVEELCLRTCSNVLARRVLMYCACVYCRHGQSLTELANGFGISVSGLTRARDRVAAELRRNRELQKQVRQMEATIKGAARVHESIA